LNLTYESLVHFEPTSTSSLPPELDRNDDHDMPSH
jgi:hypothetical protein